MKPLFTSILFLTILSFNPVLADIITVSGDVSGTWSADTVLVVGEVQVPQGQALEISPGVKVLFNGYYRLRVLENAQLHANGTVYDSITFSPLLPDSNWGGIRFETNLTLSVLEYCHITRGESLGEGDSCFGGGIFCWWSNLEVLNCLIDSCLASVGGGISCGYSNVDIQDCIIRGNSAIVSENGPGWGGGIYADNAVIEINRSTIIGNTAHLGGGLCFCHFGSPTVTNCTIADNVVLGELAMGAGIYCYYYCRPIIVGNRIYNNRTPFEGGGIYLSFDSDGLIKSNILLRNYAYNGGAIRCNNSSPIIRKNIIVENYAENIGGGLYYQNAADPFTDTNIISENYSRYGGGIYGINLYSHCKIINNVISYNSATFYGGGINIKNQCPNSLKANMILYNHASYGGGIYCDHVWSPSFISNVIAENTAISFGGGICLSDYNEFSNPWIRNNTITANFAHINGGAFACLTDHASSTLLHTISWENNPQEVYLEGSANISATYSDVQDTLWPGLGNISDDPLFINPALNDYRLQWGSPCIDTGDPDPMYNDPDGTRADMGAFYFDQSVPVRILLSPHEIPYLIPEEGGTMDYTIRGDNIEDVSQAITVWCDVTLPDSSVYGPVLGPVTLTIESGQTVERIRTQTVPASAPMGVYHYNAYAVVDQDTSKDSFMFGKLGTVIGGIDGWGNAGDPLITIGGGSTPALQATEFALLGTYPNPFNPSTTISFALPEAGKVTLSVYDVTGRLVTTLVDGHRNAGVHEVTFDASQLASGIYIYRLEAGQFTASGKMVLMK